MSYAHTCICLKKHTGICLILYFKHFSKNNHWGICLSIDLGRFLKRNSIFQVPSSKKYAWKTEFPHGGFSISHTFFVLKFGPGGGRRKGAKIIVSLSSLLLILVLRLQKGAPIWFQTCG